MLVIIYSFIFPFLSDILKAHPAVHFLLSHAGAAFFCLLFIIIEFQTVHPDRIAFLNTGLLQIRQNTGLL